MGRIANISQFDHNYSPLKKEGYNYDCFHSNRTSLTPWNKGQLIGQKPPFKLREIWAIRIRLQLKNDPQELAMFNLAIDSKLRSCDLVHLRVRDVYQGHGIAPRAMVLQQKTHQPVQFEITEQTREALTNWISHHHFRPDDYLFPSRIKHAHHLSHSTICPDRPQVGRDDWPQYLTLWHAFITKNQSHAHLQKDKKSSSRAAFIRTH